MVVQPEELQIFPEIAHFPERLITTVLQTRHLFGRFNLAQSHTNRRIVVDPARSACDPLEAQIVQVASIIEFETEIEHQGLVNEKYQVHRPASRLYSYCRDDDRTDVSDPPWQRVLMPIVVAMHGPSAHLKM